MQKIFAEMAENRHLSLDLNFASLFVMSSRILRNTYMNLHKKGGIQAPFSKIQKTRGGSQGGGSQA